MYNRRISAHLPDDGPSAPPRRVRWYDIHVLPVNGLTYPSVSAVMLSSALSRQEAESIKAQLRSIAYGQCSEDEEIKLCYVTVRHARLIGGASDGS